MRWIDMSEPRYVTENVWMERELVEEKKRISYLIIWKKSFIKSKRVFSMITIEIFLFIERNVNFSKSVKEYFLIERKTMNHPVMNKCSFCWVTIQIFFFTSPMIWLRSKKILFSHHYSLSFQHSFDKFILIPKIIEVLDQQI